VAQRETPGPIFQGWLKAEIVPFMSTRGWRRRGLAFEQHRQGNIGFVEFVRSPTFTGNQYEFTVDVAIHSPRLAAVKRDLTELEPPTRPNPQDAAFNQPLGWLMGERTPVYWRVRAPSLSLELAALGENVRDKLERYALPWLDAHWSDEQLRDALIDHAEGLGGLGIRELHRLVTDLGPDARLAEIEELLRTERDRSAARRAADLAEMNSVDAAADEVRAADEAMRQLSGGARS
jgi:hypothetical protein